MSRKYAVETEFAGFWENVWREETEDGIESLVEFDSVEEAEAEIALHCAAMQRAVDDGFMTDAMDASEFRVVSV